MNLLITNIKELLQIRDQSVKKVAGEEMKSLPSLKKAYVYVKDGKIEDFGLMSNLDTSGMQVDKIIDAEGRIVMPGWCDSHTHIVYAGNREQEFVDRINGLSYEEIAKRGGGILNSAKKLQEASESELYEQSRLRLETAICQGTTAIEIKSGYGLNPEAEIKMLKVIQRLKRNYELPVRATFLGAHALPSDFKSDKDGYLDQVISMLPEIAEQKLADYIDIFCEEGYFSVADTERLLKAGQEHGLIPKIHVNQFNAIGGVQAGIKYNALSVDHLEEMRTEDIDSLLQAEATMPVALPACSYFLSIPYTPARKMIDAGLALALATDYNPGSSPSGNMNFVVSTACIKMKMTPEEAINAATINGAYAMGISDTHGSITEGKAANLIITKKISSYYYLPYSFGEDLIYKVLVNGKLQ
ncbi:imidazolonepropionase [Leptobacterium flavescens]|uniref:Imidazolonepropionase n=1 Tax=Leptobacterium flavescens TaxID=472055 RepID=A0A6P0UKF4_9FLAO|nr:imidazolonepropionase [Leptobacterium flavescens]NER13851.1 imidazolonepropionase [Leptobacterium flavescens]